MNASVFSLKNNAREAKAMYFSIYHEWITMNPVTYNEALSTGKGRKSTIWPQRNRQMAMKIKMS